MKPFTALAYGEQHDFQYPAHTCRGTATGCWLPRGHGEIGLTSAIAYSFNSYFRVLAANMATTDVAQIAARFGIEPPDREPAAPHLRESAAAGEFPHLTWRATSLNRDEGGQLAESLVPLESNPTWRDC